MPASPVKRIRCSINNSHHQRFIHDQQPAITIQCKHYALFITFESKDRKKSLSDRCQINSYLIFVMKAAINVSRFLVGVLFIFSGLVKANDPLSLGYKMQEFFEIWNNSLSKSTFFLSHTLIQLFQFLHEHSLALAVVMIAVEIIAGAALLLGWRMKLFGWILLLLIIFFTFLTGYALLSGKFKNCGCFGDCLPITPKVSFLKDIVLTILIGFLFWHRN